MIPVLIMNTMSDKIENMVIIVLNKTMVNIKMYNTSISTMEKLINDATKRYIG